MGLLPDRFRSRSNDFACPICHGVIADLIDTPCQHLFCFDCIKQAIAENPSCPTCRGPLTMSSLRPAHDFIRNQHGALELSCENVERGCPAIVSLDNLAAHQSSCSFAAFEDESLVARFVSLTHANTEVAEEFLQLCNNNFEQAAQLFLDSLDANRDDEEDQQGEIIEFPPPVEQEVVVNEVRAPIPAFMDRLDGGDEQGNLGFEEFQVPMEMLLQQQQHPCLDLAFQGTLEEATELAKAAEKVLLVNIQGAGSGGVDWSSQELQQVIGHSVVFLLLDRHSDQGREWLRLYMSDGIDFPVLTIVQPHTMELLHCFEDTADSETVIHHIGTVLSVVQAELVQSTFPQQPDLPITPRSSSHLIATEGCTSENEMREIAAAIALSLEDSPNMPRERMEPVAPRMNPVVPRMEPVAPRMNPVVPRMEPVVSQMRSVVPRMEPVVPRMEPVVPRMEPVAPRMNPVVSRMEPVVPRMNSVVPRMEPVVSQMRSVVPRMEPVVPQREPRDFFPVFSQGPVFEETSTSLTETFSSGERAYVPEEPSEGEPNTATFRFRLPDGSQLVRKFYAHNTIEDMRNFVLRESELSSSIVIRVPLGGIDLSNQQMTLEDVGLVSDAVVIVDQL